MATDEMSPQRKAAHLKWRQAQQEGKKGRADKAIELARAALDDDPEFLDVRMWIAQQYIDAGDTRKATRELEEVIHADQDHQEAWGVLREIDAPTAQRLERLQDIAADPFVTQRADAASDALGGMDELLEDGDDAEPDDGLAPGEIGADPFYAEIADADEFEDFADRDQPADGDQPADTPDTEQATAPAPQASGAMPWEYEQDREYLAKWAAEPAVIYMVASIQELWKELDVWDSLLQLCAHADIHVHPKLFEAAQAAAAGVGVDVPELFTFPERVMHPVIIKDKTQMLAIPTGLMRGMSQPEIIFHIGRKLGHLRTGYLPHLQTVEIVTDRKAALVADVASSVRDFLADHMERWDTGVSKDEIARHRKLGHAWQQRCELSADRAGLLACRDADVACAALARGTARSPEDTPLLSVERFLKQFEGQDVGGLAAIPPAESPLHSLSYTAYRIHMLRWWASTPDYKALAQA